MNRKNRRKIRKANRRISNQVGRRLIFSAGATLMALPVAFGQTDSTAEPSTMEKIVVTGSNIPTAETVQVAPVAVMDAAKIQEVGATDVLDVLRKVTPVFVGNGNYGQEVNNGGSGESYAAIRNLPTLVLLNGRRMASSSFSSGTAVDLNTLPVSMIERVEVFKDGASAIYGADAVGGVINIIMKKGWNGVEISGRYGFTTRDDNYFETDASVVGGISYEKGWITAGAQYFYSEPLQTSDRKTASLSLPDLIKNGINSQTYISPTYPRINNAVLAGSEFAKGSPGYNPAMTTIPPEYLGSTRTLDELIAAGVFVDLANTPQGSQLLDLGVGGYPLLNTTQYGTFSKQSQDRRQFFSNFEHELIGRGLMMFGDFLFSDSSSEGRLAPAPHSYLGLYNTTIPADNPYNPFGIDLGSNGAGSPRVRTRWFDVGPRIYQYESTYYRFTGGLKGEISEDSDWVDDLSWETAFNYNKSDQLGMTLNTPSGAAVNLALQPNWDVDPTGMTSMLMDSTGNYVPTYNYFTLGTGNDPATIDAMRSTLYQKGVSELYTGSFLFRGSAFNLPAGKIGFALGGDYRYESLSVMYDYLTINSLAIGGNTSGNFPGGDRNIWDGYVEVSIPVFSDQNAVPALAGLEITAAGRYEVLDPGGDTAVPRVGLKWQPIDKQVTLRGTYSQGFLAPSLFSVFGAPQQNYPSVNLPDGGGQVLFNQFSSPDQKPSESYNYTAGIVVSPKAVKGLTASVDYYYIDNPGIYLFDYQGLADNLNALGSDSPFADGFRFSDGTRLENNTPGQIKSIDDWGTANIYRSPSGQQRTSGIDFGLSYEKEFEKAGTFVLGCNANYVLFYEVAGSDGKFYDYAGYYTAGIYGANGTIPQFFVIPSLTWQYEGLTAALTARYIPSVTDAGDLFDAVGGESHGNTANGKAWEVDDWYSIDMQVAYEFGKTLEDNPWYKGFRLAVGVNNLTDNDPPLLAAYGAEDNTDKSTYDIMGRFVYFTVSKKF